MALFVAPGLSAKDREWRKSCQHSVQLYDDDRVLAAKVSDYLGEGLKRGERVIAIASGAHLETFMRQLEARGLEPARIATEGRLWFLDARQTLAKFMIDGQPDPARFENAFGSLVRDLVAQSGDAGLRAYGEMVDVLWNAGHSSAAMRLEEMWNQLLAAQRFRLLCAYQIDVFSKEFQGGVLNGVLCAHTQIMSAGVNEALETAVDDAIQQVLGSRANGLKLLISANLRPSWGTIPQAEATVLWLRNNLPDYADEIVARARGSYQASTNAYGDSYQN